LKTTVLPRSPRRPISMSGHEQPFDILALIVENRSFALVTSSRLEDMIDARRSGRQRSRFVLLTLGLKRAALYKKVEVAI